MAENFSLYGIVIALFLILLANKFCKNKWIYRIRIIAVTIIAYFLFNTIFTALNYELIKEKSEFLNQIVNISGILVGFIFAGISILFTLISMDKMRSKFKNGFLDKVFHKSFLCIFSSISVIVLYFWLSIYEFDIQIFKVMLYAFAYSLFYMSWCLVDFFKLIFKSKDF